MFKRFGLGFAVGYVVGAKSGRGGYDKLAGAGRRVLDVPVVQNLVAEGQERARDAGRRAFSSIREAFDATRSEDEDDLAEDDLAEDDLADDGLADDDPADDEPADDEETEDETGTEEGPDDALDDVDGRGASTRGSARNGRATARNGRATPNSRTTTRTRRPQAHDRRARGNDDRARERPSRARQAGGHAKRLSVARAARMAVQRGRTD